MITKPTKLNETVIKTALKLAKEGKSITFICKFLEINRTTYYNWAEQVPELKESVDKEIAEAKKREMEKVKKSLYALTQKRKLVKVTEHYDENNNYLGKKIETQQVDPNVNAINSYLDRNGENLGTDNNTITIKIDNE